MKTNIPWRQKWGPMGPKDATDAVIIVGNVRIAAHNAILAAESDFYRKWLAERPQSSDIPELQLHYVSIHTVWRVMELLYCQTYSSKPCPHEDQPDDKGDLEQRGAVYQLAGHLGLSQILQDTAFEYFRQAIEGDWKIENLLNSINTILHPILQVDSLENLEKEDFRNDRIVTLMFHHLHERRALFKEDDCLLSAHLQSVPIFMELFIDSWSTYI
ncbi:VID27 cytoplasmic family protein [Aspergillus niger]|uniref:VID27 cytoplasmic family protein n=1 Tax=Aspergillus niger TaxID=5061 RepID=A0A254UCU7_ASPNG|nr:VID27 cytoplasmic family protein [Aspergillus niger]SPB49724.1 unnamed protein product [Aspergillus niger]